MRIEFETARARRLSLTSLIDVIFLLLLFFMLTSTFTKFSTVELSASGQGAGSKTPDVVISLKQTTVLVNGVEVSSEALAGALKSKVTDGKTSALLLVGRSVASQHFITTLQLARRLGLMVSVVR
ncbi:MAG: biopolymer transporter ExbD [Pseudomonadota bacterium]